MNTSLEFMLYKMSPLYCCNVVRHDADYYMLSAVMLSLFMLICNCLMHIGVIRSVVTHFYHLQALPAPPPGLRLSVSWSSEVLLKGKDQYG